MYILHKAWRGSTISPISLTKGWPGSISFHVPCISFKNHWASQPFPPKSSRTKGWLCTNSQVSCMPFTNYQESQSFFPISSRTKGRLQTNSFTFHVCPSKAIKKANPFSLYHLAPKGGCKLTVSRSMYALQKPSRKPTLSPYIISHQRAARYYHFSSSLCVLHRPSRKTNLSPYIISHQRAAGY